jgi:hypothetical protein
MKSIMALTAVVALALTGPAMAAPGKHHGYKAKVGKITVSERLAIARSQAQLLRIKMRARADGRVTPFERRMIQQAQLRHDRLVALARRS